MSSTFGGLSLANTALQAQRRAIETTGHNVANANTEGYSRQRVDLAALRGGAISLNGATMYTGEGVEVLSQTRLVDQFLISRANTERATLGLYSERQSTFNAIELTIGEPGDNSLSNQMDEFWSAWDTVSLAPDDEAARTALLQRADAVADRFNSLMTEMDNLAKNAIQRADATTVDINGIAAQLAELNISIAAATEAGAPPNDLLDQRDLLVRKLSTYVGVTTREHSDGQMDVSIGGAQLVSTNRHQTVSLDTSVPGAAVLRISSSTTPLKITSGTMAGMLETANQIIPAQQAQLDAIALQLRDVVNAQHVLGQDLDGNAGTNFFSGTGARDFALSASVAGQPRRVAAALAGEGGLSGNNAVAMAELSGLSGGPTQSYRALIARLGVNAQTANQRLALQQELTTQVDEQRESVSGVSIDEEMTNLVAYQQAYDASARFMTAIDEMLDRLINGTGAVGR